MASLNRGLELALLLTLPATVALLVIPWPIVIVLFERGAFDRAASDATAWALAAYAGGLPAFVLIKLLQPAFYAREDTMTPLKMALIGVAANVALSLALFWLLRGAGFGHVGLALATALAAWLTALLLAGALRGRGFLAFDARLRRRLPRIALASLAMGAVLWVVQVALTPWFAEATPVRVAALAILIAAGSAAYGVLVLALGALDRAELAKLLRRRAS
jgi:putative peptidoglycan lipid II flippase